MKSEPLTRLELDLSELLAIVERAVLSDEDRHKLSSALQTLAVVTRELEAKSTTIGRLRKMLFGASTEKTRSVCGPPERDGETASPSDAPGSDGPSSGAASDDLETPSGEGQCVTDGPGAKEDKPKRKGHGRRAADDYRGAERILVPHHCLRPGAACPLCLTGKLYPLRIPAVLVRIRGQAPLMATVYEKERLRCSPCGEVFEANTPDGIDEAKYDESAAAMVGLLKYGSGSPFFRIARLQASLGVPLPAGTQWGLVHAAANSGPGAAYTQLVREAAQGEVVHNDDTTARILELMGKRLKKAAPSEEPSKRTGIFTSGIVSVREGLRIALFFTGRQHAGENLADVLAQRAKDLSAPIQMCDGLTRNLPGAFKTILSNCLAHGRRRFVDVNANFPDECKYVLETLRDVYRNDDVARDQKLSHDKRLVWHQAESAPLMKKLEDWLKEQVDEKKVEPNSGLGEAIGYMRDRWHELTQFLRVPGAPLDNNICERILKKAILHRKNSMFFKTENGARVGDIFMSLIHTAELCGANPFDYLVALQRHDAAVRAAPAEWMPWNYELTRALLAVRS